METVIDFFKTIFGIGADELSILQIMSRCIVIYIFGIILIRIGDKRFIGKLTGFDIIIAVVIGSLLSRGITEPDRLLTAMAACLLLILIHRLFSFIAFHSDRFGDLIKGQDRVVIRDGEIQWDAVRKSHLSRQDLLQSLRLNAHTGDVSKIKIARLERNGDISVIFKEEES